MELDSSWHKKRNYLHFDQPLSFDKASSLVTSPDKVARHAFFPSISFPIVTSKFKRNKESGKLEKTFKTREITYFSHVDSYIYAYYTQILSVYYENRLCDLNLEDNVLAFRRLGKSNIHFALTAFEEIGRRECSAAIAQDVSNFFGTIDHLQLKKAWCNLLKTKNLPNDHYNIFKSITKYSYIDKLLLLNLLNIPLHNQRNGRHKICSINDFRNIVRSSGLINKNIGAGIPQGSPISALLSNIYLLDFDYIINEKIKKLGGKYFRYCDDILCIVHTKYKDEIETLLTSTISKFNLTINKDKTEIRLFSKNDSGMLVSDKPLQYLGFIFNGNKIFIRNAALSRYSERTKSTICVYGKSKLNKDKVRIEKGLKISSFYKKKLYKKYGYIGRRNFISYGYKAAKIMNSESIRKQLKPLWKRLNDRINRESDKIVKILNQ